MSRLINIALENFDTYLYMWKDMPDYIYTCEYKNAFYEYIKSRIDLKTKPSDLVLYTLHHENGISEPCFKFDRDMVLDKEEVTLCRFFYKTLDSLKTTETLNKKVHIPKYLQDYIAFVKEFMPKKLGLFTVEYLSGKIVLNR